MGGMFGCVKECEDAEEDGGVLAGGGEGSPRRLGVRGEDRGSWRPRFEEAGDGTILGSAGCEGVSSVTRESSSEGKSSSSDMTAQGRSQMLRDLS